MDQTRNGSIRGCQDMSIDVGVFAQQEERLYLPDSCPGLPSGAFRGI